MKNLLTFFLVLSISGCHTEDGNFSYPKTAILGGIIILIMYTATNGAKKIAAEKLIKDTASKQFDDDFYNALQQNNIVATNRITQSNNIGLAIADNKENICVFNSDKMLNIISKNKINSCDLVVNNDTIMTTKTKAPIVSWNTTGNTKGAMTNHFKNAVLKVTIDDIESPFLKFYFTDLELAEKYNALIKLVIQK